nr:MAG TPA: hypothetical protein [Crassvirales sp.]
MKEWARMLVLVNPVYSKLLWLVKTTRSVE